jgi:hypothetical protein
MWNTDMTFAEEKEKLSSLKASFIALRAAQGRKRRAFLRSVMEGYELGVRRGNALTCREPTSKVAGDYRFEPWIEEGDDWEC